jgi:GNAT superfamily N-acetyltransferase
VNIRGATIRDIPAILDLYAQPTIDDGKRLMIEQAEQILESTKQYPYYKLFVAELDNQVVGTFALLVMHNLGHLGKPSGVVEDVAVEPSLHRKGIGKAMMQYAMEKCRELGCYKMALSSNSKRKNAHAFYESLGFERHGHSFVVQLNA